MLVKKNLSLTYAGSSSKSSVFTLPIPSNSNVASFAAIGKDTVGKAI